MSNNTSGFKYLFVETLQKKEVSFIGYNFKYTFSKLDKNLAKPYFTGFTADITIHSEPFVNPGLIRSFLSGGNLDAPWPETDNPSVSDAYLCLFSNFFQT